MNRTAKEYDMKVNIKKTKVMKVSRKGEGVRNITIDGEILEQVERFRYLGALRHHKRWQMRDRNQDKDWYG